MYATGKQKVKTRGCTMMAMMIEAVHICASERFFRILAFDKSNFNDYIVDLANLVCEILIATLVRQVQLKYQVNA